MNGAEINQNSYIGIKLTFFGMVSILLSKISHYDILGSCYLRLFLLVLFGTKVWIWDRNFFGFKSKFTKENECKSSKLLFFTPLTAHHSTTQFSRLAKPDTRSFPCNICAFTPDRFDVRVKHLAFYYSRSAGPIDLWRAKWWKSVRGWTCCRVRSKAQNFAPPFAPLFLFLIDSLAFATGSQERAKFTLWVFSLFSTLVPASAQRARRR